MPVELLPDPSSPDALQQLELFVFHLFRPKVEGSFFVQMKICFALVVVLFFLAAVVVTWRLIQGKAWFFKLWPVADGTFVIPNSVMSFLNFQGCFTILWLAYCQISIGFYKDGLHQHNYFLWRTLVWIPLWIGGHLTTYGILSAFPDALRLKGKDGTNRRLILGPRAFNIACWGTPVIQAVSILPTAILSTVAYNRTLPEWEAWKARAQMLSAGSGDLTYDAVRSEAITLWRDVSRAYWYYGITMTLWSVWAALVFCLYVPIGAHTLNRIRGQLKIALRKERNVTPFKCQHPSLDQPLSDEQAPGSPFSEVRSSEKMAPIITSTEVRGDCYSQTKSRVFPPMRTESPTRKDNSMTVEQRRIFNLKRIFRNLSVQYVAISTAILCFFASSTIFAVDGYHSARVNKIGTSQISSNLLAAYVIVAFGFLSFGSICWRSFDPSLSIDPVEESDDHRNAKGKIKRLREKAGFLGKHSTTRGQRPSNASTESGYSLGSHGFFGNPSNASAVDPFNAAGEVAPYQGSSLASGQQQEESRRKAISSNQHRPQQREAPTKTSSNPASKEEAVYYATPFGMVMGEPPASQRVPTLSSGTVRDPFNSEVSSSDRTDPAADSSLTRSIHGKWRQEAIAMTTVHHPRDVNEGDLEPVPKRSSRSTTPSNSQKKGLASPPCKKNQDGAGGGTRGWEREESGQGEEKSGKTSSSITGHGDQVRSSSSSGGGSVKKSLMGKLVFTVNEDEQVDLARLPDSAIFV
ncbi:hypothetical protein IE53DRAFT_368063 [Violaceomyces palustris]|uniref:Uncharacterized protein n=1 Tax=Violaceomyces palustris TaxID=1673888 RepID=A0ACD0P029_9BASI|nr:hypothetical protein IE53DRAFT_368063 [Violaceomyces palustris]